MIDWRNGTWEPGDKVRYHQGHGHKEQFLEVFPGLYWYSGWGQGRFFRADGTLIDCSTEEAAAEAKRLGLNFRLVDSFIVSSFSSVQD